MVYSRREMGQLERLARKAAGVPEAKTALELVETHLPAAIDMVGQISRLCADAKIRLDACKTLVELGEVARRERERRDDQYYAGSAELLKELALIADTTQQRVCALQMFADQRMNRVDLEAVLGLIDSQKDERIRDLIVENEKLTRTIEGEEPVKEVGEIHQREWGCDQLMRDGIERRRARVERAKERALRRGGKIGPVKFKRTSFDLVGVDGSVKSYGKRADDALHLEIVLLERGQFLPSLMTHCLDGTPIPYDVLDAVGVEMFLAGHSEKVVFFDGPTSEGAGLELMEYKSKISPPRELGKMAEQSQPGDKAAEITEAVAFDTPAVENGLSPEAAEESAEFEELRINPLKNVAVNVSEKVHWAIDSWKLPGREPRVASQFAHPQAIASKKGRGAAGRGDAGPPTGTAWAQLIEVNKAKRHAYADRKEAAMNEKREIDERLRRHIRVE